MRLVGVFFSIKSGRKDTTVYLQKIRTHASVWKANWRSESIFRGWKIIYYIFFHLCIHVIFRCYCMQHNMFLPKRHEYGQKSTANPTKKTQRHFCVCGKSQVCFNLHQCPHGLATIKGHRHIKHPAEQDRDTDRFDSSTGHTHTPLGIKLSWASLKFWEFPREVEHTHSGTRKTPERI